MGCSLTNGTREMRIMITYNGKNMCKDDGIVLESCLAILEFSLFVIGHMVYGSRRLGVMVFLLHFLLRINYS